MPKRRNSEDHPYREAPHVRNGDLGPVSEQQLVPTWDRDGIMTQVCRIHDTLDHLFLQREIFYQTLNSPDRDKMDWHLIKQSKADRKKKTKGNNDAISMMRKENASIQGKLKRSREKVDKVQKENKDLIAARDNFHNRYREEEQKGLFAQSNFNNRLKEATGKQTTTDVSSGSQG
ncbi:hypothetical protein ACHAPJ_011068 [Fusarium lateritium]